MTDEQPRVAVFRPADERIERATARLESLGADPVPDPMLAIEPTGAAPQRGADFTVLTSKTGVECAAEAGWRPGETTICAIGPATADVLDEHDYPVDLVPDEYTSSGLVEAMERAYDLDGASIEVARSDHGSQVLLDGLANAGASVTETVLYRLARPAESGESAELAARGNLDAACFTSSLTVEHFLDAADERGVRDEMTDALSSLVVSAIGEPTAETAAETGLEVDLVASEATFETLAEETVDALGERART